MPEIRKITGRSNGSVSKYIKGVNVLPDYRGVLKSKQGGSKERARKNWLQAKENASNILETFSTRDRLLFLAAIYWGEGSKSDFNLINGDPYLIRAFLKSLYVLGVQKDRIKFNLRLFSDMDKSQTIGFWVNFLEIEEKQIGKCEIIEGDGRKKLMYGMCRVRVEKAGPYFKLVMSMIDHIKSNSTLS